MEMHPDDRPASVAELRKELFAPSLPDVVSQFIPAEDEWVSAARENRVLIAVALGLMLMALLVTMLAPKMPP